VVFSVVGIWCTLFYEHSVLCHRQIKITNRVFHDIHILMCWLTHFGSSPYQWAISHRLHHMFGDVKGLDPYSSIVVGFWRIFFNSAGHLHKYNSRPGHNDIFPDLQIAGWEKKLFDTGRAWNVLAMYVLFTGVPQVLHNGTIFSHLLLALAGVVAGLVGISVSLIGGGLINSLAHSLKYKIGLWLGWYKKTLAWDGTTAQNRPIWGWILRELWHLNHHNRPTVANFGWRKWYQLDLVYQFARLWQVVGFVEIKFDGPIRAQEDKLAAWVENWSEAEDRIAYLKRVMPHVPPELWEALPEDPIDRCAKVAMCIINGQLEQGPFDQNELA